MANYVNSINHSRVLDDFLTASSGGIFPNASNEVLPRQFAEKERDNHLFHDTGQRISELKCFVEGEMKRNEDGSSNFLANRRFRPI